jgi:hypothetical protein
MISEAEGRLAAILQRELGATSVSFARGGEEPAPSDTTLACAAPNGTWIVAHFDQAPPDREARSRRLEMIVASFADLLEAPPGEQARHHKPAAPMRSLAGELTALTGRAGALAALVVDARSPVIWGASDVLDGPDDAGEETSIARLYRKAAHAGLRFTTLVSEPVLDTEGDPDEPDLTLSTSEIEAAGGGVLSAEERAELWRRVLLVRNALSAVRALPQVVGLHKGEHLHESVRAPELSYVVRSFATIYMLLVVFERPFDELRAERAVTHALPTIERLVLALPPMDPGPPVAGAGVMRIRRR